MTIADLLAAAERSGDDSSAEWSELWDRLCHQGSVHEASFAALPDLAAIADRHEPAHWNAALHLSAFIIGSDDRPEMVQDPRTTYADSIALLRDLAERDLGLAVGETEFAYAMQALMAFEDGGPWQRHLEVIANGEATLQCPGCAELLLLNLEGPEFAVADFSDATFQHVAVEPGIPEPGSVEARVQDLAAAHDQAGFAHLFGYLLGSTSCPRCGVAIAVPDALQ